jgi:hypothetical protein
LARRRAQRRAVTDAGPVTLTFDSSPRDGSPGAARLRRRPGGARAGGDAGGGAPRRRARLLRAPLRPRAAQAARATPNRPGAEEEWSGGGPTSNFGPGGWTACGRACASRRPRPLGGTETATSGAAIWRAPCRPAMRGLRRRSAGECGRCGGLGSSDRASHQNGALDGLRDEDSRHRGRVKVRSPGPPPCCRSSPRHLPPGLVVPDQPRAARLRQSQGLRPRPEPDQLGAGALPRRHDHRPGAGHLLARDQAVMGASRLAGKEPLNGWIAIILYLLLSPGSLGLHPGLAQRRLARGGRSLAGQEPPAARGDDAAAAAAEQQQPRPESSRRVAQRLATQAGPGARPNLHSPRTWRALCTHPRRAGEPPTAPPRCGSGWRAGSGSSEMTNLPGCPARPSRQPAVGRSTPSPSEAEPKADGRHRRSRCFRAPPTVARSRRC